MVDLGDTVQCANQLFEGSVSTSQEPKAFPDENTTVSDPVEDRDIDKRVGALLEGYHIIPGQELETIRGNFLFTISLCMLIKFSSFFFFNIFLIDIFCSYFIYCFQNPMLLQKCCR